MRLSILKLSDNHKRIIRDSGTLFLKEFVGSSNIKYLDLFGGKESESHHRNNKT